MKNFKKFILLILSLCFLSLFGCSKSNNLISSQQILSEYRKNLFVGKGSCFTVTFTTGEREQNYIMDGKPTKLVDFGVITIKFVSIPNNFTAQFEFNVNKDKYAGQLERNPYDGTYVFDIEKQVEDGASINIYLVDFDEYVSLSCLSKNWKTTYTQAKNIFIDKYKKEISLHTKDGYLEGEIYIKIVSNEIEMKNIYWYVLLVCENGEMYSSLIDVKTGEILQN